MECIFGGAESVYREKIKSLRLLSSSPGRKLKDIRKTHEVVEKFKLCQQVGTSVFVSPRTLVNVTFPFL